MSDDMVMRSVYLRPRDDAELRQLAFREHVSKSDLIRSAIRAKLTEWWQDREAMRRDLELGRRDRDKGRVTPMSSSLKPETVEAIEAIVGPSAGPALSVEETLAEPAELTAPVLQGG